MREAPGPDQRSSGRHADGGIAAITEDVSHRPWPLPRLPWIMFQSWRDLLFAHWPLPAERLRDRVPTELTLDEFDGTAWIGLTPFRVAGLRVRCLPPLPDASEFPELNLRTYVRVDGKPGIFFFSLDAGSRLAVWGARTAYRLPYRRARMTIEAKDEWIDFRSRREEGEAELSARYRPTGSASRPAPGTLEHFLFERYALYVVLRSGRILRGDIHHRPWWIQPAEMEITSNTVASAQGIRLPDQEPLTHFSSQQDTLIWPPRTV